jgi:hypothetical protein
MRARYYNPYLMRFINADPMGFSGGMNWYSYAGNSPLMFVDIGGLCPSTTEKKGWFESAWSSVKRETKGAIGPYIDGANNLGVGLERTWAAVWTAPIAIYHGLSVSEWWEVGNSVTAGHENPALKAGWYRENLLTEGIKAGIEVGSMFVGGGLSSVGKVGNFAGKAGTTATTVAAKSTTAASTVTKVSGRAPEFVGGKVGQSGFLRAAEQYLGHGYKEISSGRYVSADGLRQVRFGAHEVKSSQLHGHFEAYDKVGGRIIENTRVNIIGD